jgi:hypothetical protein
MSSSEVELTACLRSELSGLIKNSVDSLSIVIVERCKRYRHKHAGRDGYCPEESIFFGHLIFLPTIQCHDSGYARLGRREGYSL